MVDGVVVVGEGGGGEVGGDEVELYMEWKVVVEEMKGGWKMKEGEMEKLGMEGGGLGVGECGLERMWKE